MHFLMLVTLAVIPNETAAEALRRVDFELTSDASFCGEGGRFGSPHCDWFVLGGRWSGLLQRRLLGDAYREAFDQEFPGEFFTTRFIEEHQDRLNHLWSEHGGTGPHPLNRDGYSPFDDDAMIVTPQLYQHFLSPHDPDHRGEDTSDLCEFVDLDDETLSNDFVGRKWLVVVDYHN